MKKDLWTADFVATAISNFLIHLAYFELMVIMASHAIDALGATHSEAGLATGLFILGSVAARIMTGRAIAGMNEKKALFIGLAIYFATTFLYFSADSLLRLDIARFLHGFGFGVSATAAGTIAARIIPEGRRGEGIGYYALSSALSSAIGPFIGMSLNDAGNFKAVLFVCAALLATAAVAASAIHVPARADPGAAGGEKGPRARPGIFSPGSYFEPSVVPVSIVCMLVVLCYSGILAFITPYARANGLESAGGLFFLVYSVFVLIARPVTGRLFDVKGENYVIYPSILIFSAGLALLGMPRNGEILLTSAALIGFGYGAFFSCGNAIAIKASRPDKFHLATSTYYAFADLGAGAGPYLLGLAIPVLGFSGLYLFLAGFALCCCLFYHLAHGGEAARRSAGTAVKT